MLPISITCVVCPTSNVLSVTQETHYVLFSSSPTSARVVCLTSNTCCLPHKPLVLPTSKTTCVVFRRSNSSCSPASNMCCPLHKKHVLLSPQATHVTHSTSNMFCLSSKEHVLPTQQVKCMAYAQATCVVCPTNNMFCLPHKGRLHKEHV